MKRIISLLLIIVLTATLAFSAAGCNKQQDIVDSSTQAQVSSQSLPSAVPFDPNEEPESIPQDEPESESASSVASKPEFVPMTIPDSMKKSGDISLYIYKYSDKSEIAEFYESNCGGEVKFVEVLFENIDKRIVSDFAAGQDPDVILLPADRTAKILKSGVVYNKSQLSKKGIKNLDHPAIKAVETETANCTTFNGNVYALDIELHPTVIVCNDDLIKKCGAAKTPIELYREGNWNWNSFMSIVKLVEKFDEDGDSYSDFSPFKGWNYYWVVAAHGGQLIKESKGNFTLNLNDNKVMNGFKALRTLYANNSSRPYAFADGNMAMYAYATTTLSKDRFQRGWPFKWSVVPFPTAKGVDPINIGSFDSFGVSSHSDNIQGAVNFIIAQAVYNYNQNKLEPIADLEFWVDDEGKKIIEDARKNSVNRYWADIGIIQQDQWNFWGDIIRDKKSISQVIEDYKGIFEASIAST